MSAKDKFYTRGITTTVPYIKNTTVELPDIRFFVSSSATDTILHVLPTSSVEGIKFYTIGGAEITPNTRIQLWPGEAGNAHIIAKIDSTDFNNFEGSSIVEFPVKFELSETPIPPSSTPPGSTFVCRPCLDEVLFNESCGAGYDCINVNGQRCCVEKNGTYNGIPPLIPVT